MEGDPKAFLRDNEERVHQLVYDAVAELGARSLPSTAGELKADKAGEVPVARGAVDDARHQAGAGSAGHHEPRAVLKSLPQRWKTYAGHAPPAAASPETRPPLGCAMHSGRYTT